MKIDNGILSALVVLMLGMDAHATQEGSPQSPSAELSSLQYEIRNSSLIHESQAIRPIHSLHPFNSLNYDSAQKTRTQQLIAAYEDDYVPKAPLEDRIHNLRNSYTHANQYNQRTKCINAVGNTALIASLVAAVIPRTRICLPGLIGFSAVSKTLAGALLPYYDMSTLYAEAHLLAKEASGE